jgi:hypothetical protein
MGHEHFFCSFSTEIRLSRGVEERIFEGEKKLYNAKRGNCQKIMIYSRFSNLFSLLLPALACFCDFCLEKRKEKRIKKKSS